MVYVCVKEGSEESEPLIVVFFFGAINQRSASRKNVDAPAAFCYNTPNGLENFFYVGPHQIYTSFNRQTLLSAF